jgi:hypothetical protein
MANIIKMFLLLRVYADNKHFPKNSTVSFNQANDVYVKIYETAQLTMFYVFLIKEQISTFSVSSGSLSLVKYPALSFLCSLCVYRDTWMDQCPKRTPLGYILPK